MLSIGDIWLNGGTLNTNNSLLYIPNGSVTIDVTNVGFSGLIYAPNGKVDIKAQNLNLNNTIIPDKINLEGEYININYRHSWGEFIGKEQEKDDDSSSEIDSSSFGNSSEIDESSSQIDSSKLDDSSSKDDSSKTDDSSTTDTDYLDDDGDGLANTYEELMGTDKANPDTDNDGLTDFQEIVITNTDPLVFDSVTKGISDADADSDKDGLSNIKEIELGTEPQNADTDLDGLSDGDEVALGLDPKNATSDGKTPDNERTFSQHLGIDAENFVEINTDDNPFNVSMDIIASGNAKNNLNAFESGYTNIINSDMVLGVVPEFMYTNGLNVEEATINFDLKQISEDGKYAAVSDEFKGIKKYNVFKFFEDINMLLPIETFFDEENDRVYTHVDELGTYCLVNTEKWFENLNVGLTSNKARNVNLFSLKQRSEETIDVVFSAFMKDTTSRDIKPKVRENILQIGEKLFNEYGSSEQVRIALMSYTEDFKVLTNTKQYYATNMDELKLFLEVIPFSHQDNSYVYNLDNSIKNQLEIQMFYAIIHKNIILF